MRKVGKFGRKSGSQGGQKGGLRPQMSGPPTKLADMIFCRISFSIAPAGVVAISAGRGKASFWRGRSDVFKEGAQERLRLRRSLYHLFKIWCITASYKCTVY